MQRLFHPSSALGTIIVGDLIGKLLLKGTKAFKKYEQKLGNSFSQTSLNNPVQKLQ